MIIHKALSPHWEWNQLGFEESIDLIRQCRRIASVGEMTGFELR
jgi:hypothetical protein